MIAQGFQMDKEDIKDLCGRTAYNRGVPYYQQGAITHFDYDPVALTCDAVVSGSEEYEVYIYMDSEGNVDAGCDCPAFGNYYDYCKHIAAVLLQIVGVDAENSETVHTGNNAIKKSYFQQLVGDTESRVGSGAAVQQRLMQVQKEKERRSAEDVIQLLSSHALHSLATDSAQDISSKTPLELEVTCSPAKSYYSGLILLVEIRVGIGGRFYIVQKIKRFLEDFKQGHPHRFSNRFTCDPEVHYFMTEHQPVVDLLWEIVEQETYYEKRASYSGFGSRSGQDKWFTIPPLMWDFFYARASKIGVLFEGKGKKVPLQVVEDGHPEMEFGLDRTDDGMYRIDFSDLQTVELLESYEMVLQNDIFYKTPRHLLRMFQELKSKLAALPNHELVMNSEQMKVFIGQAVPPLEKLGKLRLSKQVADRIVRPGLRSFVHLDWQEDQLWVELEYHYGEKLIRPFKVPNSHEETAAGPSDLEILMRDPEGEQRVMNLIEQYPLRMVGGKLVVGDEQELYDMLYGVLPRLQEVAEVYMTAAVKRLLMGDSMTPRTQIDIDSDTNLLEVSFKIDGLDEADIRQVLQAVIEKRKFYRLSNGAFISLEQEDFQHIDQLLRDLDIGKRDLKGEKVRLPAVRGLLLDESPAYENRRIKFGKPLRQLLADIRNPETFEMPLPDGLKAELRDYQLHGYQWFGSLNRYGFGGILADDMGLGKTLQTITFMLSQRKHSHEQGKAMLVVVPASLIYNWEKEFRKFAPGLTTVIVAGTKAERRQRLSEAEAGDVVITSYPLIRRDEDLYEDRAFSLLILDEAQAIKNNHTQTAQAIRSINAARRFALTGTPVENSLDELWSIFDVVFPGLFPGKKAFGALSPAKVAKIARPFILRRMKKDVLDELPDKIETIESCELNKEQKKLYLGYLDKIRSDTAQRISEDGFQKSRMQILAGLTRLRQLCCHPSLFIENDHAGSGKMDRLFEMLEPMIDSGRKVLIFSQFTGMLGILRQEIVKRKWGYFYLDGSTPSRERLELVDRFNAGDESLFLISLKAGGTGLNLTGADTVILYDLWWNPAVEQQAADRAHRIGQKQVVQVIRMITQGTIEERMHELQQRKRDLIDQVIQPGEAPLSRMTEAEIREILMIS